MYTPQELAEADEWRRKRAWRKKNPPQVWALKCLTGAVVIVLIAWFGLFFIGLLKDIPQ